MEESRMDRWMSVFVRFLITAASAGLSVVEMYTAYFGVLPGMRQVAMHMGFVLSIGFLVHQPFKKKATLFTFLNILCAALMIISMLYIYINNKEILRRLPQIDEVTNVQLVFGIITLLLILELTRRTLGWALPVIAILFIIYAFTGQYFSGVLYYKGVTLPRFIEQMYLTFTGIFGEPITISATYVFLFVLFGSFLDASGAGTFFMEFSKSLVGKYRGGPGLMAVVSSALMGTISGSAIANVATTGVFTIPLMKKTGYEKNFAGAVEAVASTGGQILPPVMGAGAFIMAEYVGIPYKDVIMAALIPAVLYFFTVFIQVYFEARRLDLPGTQENEIRKTGSVIRESGYLALPLLAIIIMLVSGYSAMRAGFWGVLLIIAVSAFKKETRMGIKKIYKAMEGAAMSIISVASACCCAGIIICVIRITGLGLKFSSAIMSLSGGNLALALVLTMLSSLILGMGLPTTASYIIQATLTAPALINMGLLPIQAHLFVFYFACIAVITPPVALAAYTAAPICGGNAVTVGIKAFQLGLAAFIVPFAFAYGPQLLLIGTAGDVLLAVVTSLIGCTALAMALSGWGYGKIPIILRGMMFIAALCMVIPGMKSDLIGGALILIFAVVQISAAKCNRESAT